MFKQVWTVSRAGGQPCNVLAGTDLSVGDALAGDVSAAGEPALHWRPEGIYFLTCRRGSTGLVRWDGGIREILSGPRRVMDFTVADEGLAFTVTDALRPPEIGISDAGGRHERAITGHNAEALEEASPVPPEKLSFAGAEDAEIDGWLMSPARYAEGVRYPLVVYVHGGPTAAYGETFFHEFQVLSGQGFGVFYCNPHGGASYGERFQNSIRRQWGTVDYDDMMAGFRRVREEPWVDPNRVGVAGGSYGGFMVNWLIGHTNAFAAAVTERGICNHVSQGGTSDWAAVRGLVLGGTPEADAEHLWDRSPLKYVSAVRTPTLVIHSERDDRCPIEQGEQWFMALKRLRVPSRFVRFPEETHELSRSGRPSRRVERLEHIVRWFKAYL
jgi:dipeptidyl aminopeptidase/acylaminoacyl peptidase